MIECEHMYTHTIVQHAQEEQGQYHLEGRSCMKSAPVGPDTFIQNTSCRVSPSVAFTLMEGSTLRIRNHCQDACEAIQHMSNSAVESSA